MDKFEQELELLLKCRTPIIEVVTYEWQRLQTYLDRISGIHMTKWRRWNRSVGIIDSDGSIQEIKDAIQVLKMFLESNEEQYLILENLQLYFNSPDIIHLLFEISKINRLLNKTIIIESSELNIPDPLAKEIVVLNMPLPDKNFIHKIAESVIINYELPSSKFNLSDQVLNSLLGLTTTEVNLAFTKAVERYHKLDESIIDFLISEKEHIIKRDGLLEYYHPDGGLDSVGGLANLKQWLNVRKDAFTSEAKDFGIDTPKGVLLLGMPGCGKSLTAKSISKAWNFPLLRFDLGKVFGGIVGQSESNMRRALDIAKTIAPCVLWIDEIEKGLSGISSSDRTDGGTTSRVFGSLLTWMQEKTEPVFVVATANNIESLPPELLRKGRFDEIFFVDLPTEDERKEIFKIHLNKKNRSISDFDIQELAKTTSGLTGAEIQSIIADALFDSFSNKVKLTNQQILREKSKITPLSKVMSEKIESLRSWARNRARFAGEEFHEEIKGLDQVIRLKSESFNPLLERRE